MSQNNWNAYFDLIGLSGCAIAGQGNFSKVFKTKRNTVIKFTIDKVYYKFIKACIGVQNRYLPKILKDFGVVGHLLCDEESFEIFAMELPLYEDYYQHKPLGVSWNRYVFEDAVNKFTKYQDFETSFIFEGKVFENDLVQKITELKIKKPLEFCEALHFISTLDSITSWFDIHSDNVMWNLETDDIVIIDPIADHTTKDAISESYTESCKAGKVLTKEKLTVVEEILSLLDVGNKKEGLMLTKLKISSNFDLKRNKASEKNFEAKVKFSEEFYEKQVGIFQGLVESGFEKNKARALLYSNHWRVRDSMVKEALEEQLAWSGLVKGKRPQIEILNRKTKVHEILEEPVILYRPRFNFESIGKGRVVAPILFDIDVEKFLGAGV